MPERIIERNCIDSWREDNERYGIYVVRRRAIPSALDGLKLVQRRLVYSAYALTHAVGKTVKSSKIVSNTCGTFHPHGDTAVYEAMKPLTNWFEITIPLFDGFQGSWGSIQGDSQAAMRYTESKLTPFSTKYLISELTESKNVVDWIENYSGDNEEPESLPAKVPLLLINGTFGIAVGIKVLIPKHVPSEVIDATIKLMDNPNAPVVLIPDQCQECEIVEANWKKISNTGSGSFIVRSKIVIDYVNSYPVLHIKSTPDLTFFNKIEEKLEKLMKEKKLPQVKEMRDASKKKKGKKVDLNFEIILKKGSDPHYVKDFLYNNDTGLQKTFTVNFEALDGIEPTRFSYKSYLQYFIEKRRMEKFRLYSNKIQQIDTKLHQLNLFITIIQSGKVDDVIAAIKKYNGVNDDFLIEYLIKLLSITDIQAKYIINSPLKKISEGYLKQHLQVSKELQAESDHYTELILNDNLIDQEIKKELLDFKREYNMPRSCKIISEAALNNIPEGEFKIMLTQNNFIKKLDLGSSIGFLKNDRPKIILKTDNTKGILLFDDKGKVFRIDVHKIPLSDKNVSAIDIRKIIKNATSNINTILYEPILKDLANRVKKHFIVVITRKGLIKKMDIEDFLTITTSGIFYIKLDEDDLVKSVNIVPGWADIIVYSDNNALRMSMKDVPHLKRNAKGNNAMSTKDLLDGLAIVKPDTTHVVVVTKNGYINKMSILALPSIGRFKEPSKIIKLKKDDSIKDILTVKQNDHIKIVTKNTNYDLPVSDFVEGSSISGGTKIIPTKVDTILKCSIIKK